MTYPAGLEAATSSVPKLTTYSTLAGALGEEWEVQRTRHASQSIDMYDTLILTTSSAYAEALAPSVSHPQMSMYESRIIATCQEAYATPAPTTYVNYSNDNIHSLLSAPRLWGYRPPTGGIHCELLDEFQAYATPMRMTTSGETDESTPSVLSTPQNIPSEGCRDGRSAELLGYSYLERSDQGGNQPYECPNRYMFGVEATGKDSRDQERQTIDDGIMSAYSGNGEAWHELHGQQPGPLNSQAQVFQDLCSVPIRKWRSNVPTSLGQPSHAAYELYSSATESDQVWPAQGVRSLRESQDYHVQLPQLFQPLIQWTAPGNQVVKLTEYSEQQATELQAGTSALPQSVAISSKSGESTSKGQQYVSLSDREGTVGWEVASAESTIQTPKAPGNNPEGYIQGPAGRPPKEVSVVERGTRDIDMV